MIYLDMDGPLVDWDGAAVKLINSVLNTTAKFHPHELTQAEVNNACDAGWYFNVLDIEDIVALRNTFPNNKVTIQDFRNQASIEDSILRKVTKKLLSHESSQNWWGNLPESEWFQMIIDHCDDSHHEWCLLTKPISNNIADNRACALGKAKWAYDHLGRMRIIVTRRKELYATPHNILIDDTMGNIEKFVNAGGHGIIVPSRDSASEKAISLSFKWFEEHVL